MRLKPRMVHQTRLLGIDDQVHILHDLTSFTEMMTGMISKAPKGATVVIKPNLCCRKPAETGATTDPELVEALVACLQSKGFEEISIVESDTLHVDMDENYELLGYTDLARERDIRLVNLSRVNLVKRTFPDGRFFKGGIFLPRTLTECDLLISVAKLKTHCSERMTGSLKNLFGCIPDRDKEKFHPHLPSVLFDLCRALDPKLYIIDGMVGLEGSGPTRGKPVESKLILVGKNPVSVDSVAATIMGFEPTRVPHLRKCAEWGLGELKDIRVVGKIPYLNFEFLPEYLYRLRRRSGMWLDLLPKQNRMRLKRTIRRTVRSVMPRLLR